MLTPTDARMANFWNYKLRINGTDAADMRRVVATWHARRHPGCKALQRGQPLCKPLEILLEGLKVAKLYPELMSVLVVSIDGEYLIRNAQSEE